VPVLRPFPLHAVRDALGLVRLLYAVHLERSQGGPYYRDDPKQLIPIGRTLAESLDMARRLEPESLGYKAAQRRAEDALRDLDNLCKEHEAPSGAELAGAALRRGLALPWLRESRVPPKNQRDGPAR